MTLADPFADRGHTLADPFEGGEPNPYGRPERTEDLIPRHGNPNDGRPGIWLPDNSKRIWYSRPSSWGKKAEDTTNLSKWETRVSIDGMISYDDQSDALQAEWAATGPEDRDARNAIAQRAKGITQMADRVGTALHAMTERADHGLEVHAPNKYKADLREWERLTRFFEIITMPSGAPGIECFVAMDELRPPTIDPTSVIEHEGHRYARMVEYDGSHWTHWVRLAGTFDRLVRYTPCAICGCRNYILDLKSGAEKDYGHASFAVQLGVYSRGKEYVPWPDGKGATRYALPDICLHKGIIVYLPAGTGQGRTKWVNIAKGYDAAVGLVPNVTAHRREKNWMKEFTPVPDVWAAIENATRGDEVRALWKFYPDRSLWTPELITFASARAAALDNGEVIL